jgi:ABC-2 type transport system permease protein
MLKGHHPFVALLGKEIRSYFLTPMIYIISAIFSLIIGWLFFNYLVLAKAPTNYSLLETVVKPLMGNIHLLMMLVTPLITMGSFAGERRDGTLDLLLLSPLKSREIIGAKFIAAVAIVLFLLSLTTLCPITLLLSGMQEMAVVWSGYLGLLLCASGYISIGIFASSLTNNPIISAMLAFGVIVLLTFCGLVPAFANNPISTQLFQYLSPPFHLQSFMRGAVKSFDLLYFISLPLYFMLITNISLESRKW